MRYYQVYKTKFRHYPDAVKFRNSFKYATPVIHNKATYNPIMILIILWETR